MLAWDTETARIEEYVKAPPLVCVSWAVPGSRGLFKWDGDGLPFDPLLPCSAEPALRSLFSQPSTGLNMPYDCGVVAAKFPKLIPDIFRAYAENRVRDIGVRQRLIDIMAGNLLRPAKGKPHPYSLGEISKRVLGKEMAKGEDTWRLRYGELMYVPLSQWPEEARTYAETDAINPLEIDDAQEQLCVRLGFDIYESQYRECRADWWLHLMHCWGFRTDQARLERFAKKIGDEYTHLEEILIREGIIRNDKKRTRNISIVRTRLEAAALKAGIDPKMTAGGDKGSAPAISTDADTCKALAEHDPVLKHYARISSLKSLLTKDVTAFRGHVQIHPNFDVLMMNGRTSSYNPQTQNLPRMIGMRESVVPRPGHVIVDNDYPQIELRTWAQICLWILGYSRLSELLNDGMDPHLDLGSRILGITYEQAKIEYKKEKSWIREGYKGPTPVSDARQTSKPGNFGYMGGMSWQTFIGFAREQYDIILDDALAQKLRAEWIQMLPEAPAYFAWVKGAHRWEKKITARGKIVKTATLKHFVSGMIRGGAVYTDVCNNYFSGLAQTIGKAAVFQITRECYDETQESILFGCRPINWIHDQVLVEVPEDDKAHDRAVRVGKIMDDMAESVCPQIKTKSEPCLARRWSKNAEAIYDVNKRLIPWEEAA